MNEKSQQSISRENEIYTCNWFKAANFDCEKLPEDERPQADLLSTKNNLKIICEVKTIFSGGRVSGSQKAPKDITEDEYLKFCNKLERVLRATKEIRKLPFDVIIAFSTVHVIHEDTSGFITWLVNYILAANQYLTDYYPQYHSSKYIFTHPHKDDDGKYIGGIDADIVITRINKQVNLQVTFHHDITADYNERAFEDAFKKATKQVKGTYQHLQEQRLPHEILKTIAIWFQSIHISRFRFLTEALELSPDEVHPRYDLIDCYFKKYQDIDAIILFGFKNFDPNADLFSDPKLEYVKVFGLIIVNPFKSHLEKQFEEIFTPLGEQYQVDLGIKK